MTDGIIFHNLFIIRHFGKYKPIKRFCKKKSSNKANKIVKVFDIYRESELYLSL